MSDRLKRIMEILNQNAAANRPSATPAYPNRPSLQKRSTTPVASGYKSFKAARDRARSRAARSNSSSAAPGGSGSTGGSVTIRVSPTSEEIDRNALKQLIGEMRPADRLKLVLALKERRE